MPITAIEEARQKVFAKSFDDSREVREAINDVTSYLGLNPRKMKRFINLFRLEALIANRRGLLDAGAIELPLLAKWVVIATRWPDFVHGMMAEEGFADNLLEAFGMQERLDELEQNKTGLVNMEPELHSVKTRIDTLAADPRIERLLNAGDLLSLLRQMTDTDIKALPRYLYLAQTTTS